MKAKLISITGPTGPRLDLVSAASSARVRTTITGASTLQVRLPKDQLTAALDTALTAEAAGRRWSLAAIRRAGDTVHLVYEDAVIAALRNQTDRIMWQVALPAADIITRFCTEAGVPVDIDPVVGEVHIEGAGRSLLAETDSWREISALAARIGGRAFSDGRRLIVARDIARLAGDAVRITSSRGRVRSDIDFALDRGQVEARATFTVDTEWDVEAGHPVDLHGTGPADGRWLVAEWTRDLPLAGTGRVRLTRPRTIGE
ncbi:hypothetical protein [Microbacterium karelineae]|uniref:hypothetical protein n=1 Tax=Microbacterium karelineae TaxID=2654283 RepID=UPI0012EACF67|nr:hypothetical protein [Microbacterium karelineae]